MRACLFVAAAGLCVGAALGQTGGPVLAPYDWVGSCGQMLWPSDGWYNDRFGGSMASDGQWLLVGASNDDTACPFYPLCSSGSAYFFRRMPDGRYVQWQKVVPDDIRQYDFMGLGVAIQGSQAMVYRGGEILGGPHSAGEILIYTLSDDQWELTGKVVSGELLRSHGFGAGFELAGDMLAAATSYVDADGRFLSGAIELFRKIDGVWTYLDTVEDPLGRFRAQWIDDLALLPDGTLAVTDWQDSTAFAQAGIVRIFEPVGDRWELTQELLPPDGQPYYGFSLDADAGRIAVGHPVGLSGGAAGGVASGRVDIYERGPDQWERTHEVTLDEPAEGDELAEHVELDGDRLLTIASRAPFGGPFPSLFDGTWVVFDFDGTNWRQKVESPGPPFYLHSSSIHIELDGDTAFIAHEQWTPTPELERVGSVFAYDIGCLSCKPDLDADGTLTIFDVLLFFNAFESGDPIADFDGDGELTLFDFLAFQTAFDAGC